MGELLSTRADMLAVHITYNSLANADALTRGGAGGRSTSRASLFPAFGHLYPGGSELLAAVDDEESLRRVLLRAFPDYAALWDAAPVDSVRGGSGGVGAGDPICYARGRARCTEGRPRTLSFTSRPQS